MSIQDIILAQQREIEGRARDRYVEKDVSLKGRAP